MSKKIKFLDSILANLILKYEDIVYEKGFVLRKIVNFFKNHFKKEMNDLGYS